MSRFRSVSLPQGFAARVVEFAERIAADGGVAILGRAVPWLTHSPTHMEFSRPGAFGASSVPPPLVDGHDGPTVAHGVYTEAASGGQDAVWRLRSLGSAIDALYQRLVDGASGLSIEMVPGSRRMEPRPDFRWSAPMEIASAELAHVAIVENPSYPDARITAVVTPHAIWTPARGGRRLIPDNADTAIADRREALLTAHIETFTDLADRDDRAALARLAPAAFDASAPTPRDVAAMRYNSRRPGDGPVEITGLLGTITRAY